MSQGNPITSNQVLGPIDRDAANPSISFGASTEQGQNSGTGIRGDFNTVSVSIAGTDKLQASASGILLSNDVALMNGAGVPTDNVTGAAYAGIGSIYIDRTNGKMYINGGTKALPVWKIVTSA